LAKVLVMETLKIRPIHLPPDTLDLTPQSQDRHNLPILAGPTPVKTDGDEPSEPAPFTPSTIRTDHGLAESARIAASPEPPEPVTPRISALDDLIGDPFPRSRYRPNSTCSFLKPGARFTGNQCSDKNEYEVVVELQNVDMAESFLCGYLSIRGLTREFPTLTTYFEGEMIGSKYSFITKHPEWGANEKVDVQHWARFAPYRPLQNTAKRSNFLLKNWTQREHIWMRWKEYFLVPDHRVTDLENASFDGFYYICFNQKTGLVQGTYYHYKSER
jgi:hypothetical protein